MRNKSLQTLLSIVALVFILFVSGGQGAVVNTTSLTDVFSAVHVPPGTTGVYTGDSLAIGYSTAQLGNFPAAPGTSSGILSTGKVSDIPDVNAYVWGTDLGDYGPDGDTATLTLTIPAPSWAEFLEFDFTVLSNEWPLFTFSYNDFFSAYLNGTNIALDGNGNAITALNNYVSTTLTPDDTCFAAQTPLIHVKASLPQGATSVTLEFQIGDALDGLRDSAVSFDNIFLTPADTYVNQYTYTCQLPDGNSYHGTVYAKNDAGYGIGWTGAMNNGQGLTCTYQITDITPGTGSFDAQQGQVYIDHYTDMAIGLHYIPLNYTQGLPCGTDYLGSEEFRGGIAQVTNSNGQFYDDIHPQITDDGVIYWQGWDGHDYEIYRYDPVNKVTTMLTNNSQDDCAPQVNSSGQLTWMYYDGNDWEIRYNLGEGVRQRTNNTYDDILPQISDNGMIYWQSWDGQDYEIYRYDSVTKVTTRLTNNSQDDCALQVNSSGQVTWMYYDGNDWEIRYNIGSGVVQRTNNTYDDILPQITDNGMIYWQGWDGQDWEIYSYTFGSSASKKLTNNSQDDCAPQVNSSNQLTWMYYDGHDWEIRYNIGKSIVQRTNNTYNDILPQITDDGMIYWQGWDGHDYEIYSYTLGQSAIIQITNNTVGDITPAVKNGVLVWSQWDGNYWQIYQEVLSTGLVTQITNDHYENKNPRVSTSGQFVWMEWNGSDFEIYTFK